MRSSLWLLVAAGVLAGAELPVREVVLYKNGIGLFRRAGELPAGQSARLEFKASEMNDVLKSLTIFDEAGGKVAGLRYDSSEPLARKLGQFPFQLGSGQPLSALLDQLKGARVELRGAEAAAGAILSGREIAAGDTRPARELLTLLLDSGEIRTFDLAAVTGLRFADPVLATQVKDYLGNLVLGRSSDKRNLYIDAPATAARRYTATYVVPTPVWKSSYRLVFPESGEPLIEGWAIVDNTSSEDWTNVRLALVSGRPVSFVSHLYEPRYLQRQELELAEMQPAAPQVHAGAVQSERVEQMARLQMAPAAGFKRSLADEASMVASAPMLAAEAGEVGELFEYRFATPVTVRKGESAMLPFLQQRINARKLLIYSEAGAPNPRNAAELSNNTEKTLDGGPITVYDGAYAGEALMETLKAGDKRLISYAIDLGTRITTAFDSSRNFVRELHVRRGLLTVRSSIQETRTYTVRNVDARPKVLVIEHPVRPDYKLVSLKPSETTASAWRFELKLGAGATEKFPVAEERLVESSTALSSMTPDVLLTYVQNKSLDDRARQALERIAQQKKLVAANDSEIKRADQEVTDAIRDEDRIRSNIANLNRVAGQQEQVQKYATQLAAQETRIATLRDRLSALQTKKSSLEAELAGQIEKLEF